MKIIKGIDRIHCPIADTKISTEQCENSGNGGCCKWWNTYTRECEKK